MAMKFIAHLRNDYDEARYNGLGHYAALRHTASCIVTDAVGRALLPRFRRSSRTVNLADPTTVVTYKSRYLTLVTSYVGTCATVRIAGRTFETMAPWADRVAGILETAYDTQHAFEYDYDHGGYY
jgi:hypothetical protein